MSIHPFGSHHHSFYNPQNPSKPNVQDLLKSIAKDSEKFHVFQLSDTGALSLVKDIHKINKALGQMVIVDREAKKILTDSKVTPNMVKEVNAELEKHDFLTEKWQHVMLDDFSEDFYEQHEQEFSELETHSETKQADRRKNQLDSKTQTEESGKGQAEISLEEQKQESKEAALLDKVADQDARLDFANEKITAHEELRKEHTEQKENYAREKATDQKDKQGGIHGPSPLGRKDINELKDRDQLRKQQESGG